MRKMRFLQAIIIMMFALVFAGKGRERVFAAEITKTEIEDNIIGTLSKPGDSLPMSFTDEKEKKYIKYVSSTDETLIVYTDIYDNQYNHGKKVAVSVYDKDGKRINRLNRFYNNREDPMNTGNPENLGLLVKVKKGSVYYFEVEVLFGVVENFNIKLDKKPEEYDSCIVALYDRYGSYHDVVEMDNYKRVGVVYDKKSKILILNNYKGEYCFKIKSYSGYLTDEPLIEIKIVGENVLNNYQSGGLYGIFDIDVSAKITGSGTLTFDFFDADNDDNYLGYKWGPDINDNIIYSRCDLIIDGPIINFEIDYTKNLVEVDGKLILQKGKINVNESNRDDNDLINANAIIINGGEINITRKTPSGLLGAGLFVMNGGTINAVIKCTEKTYTYETNCFRALVAGNDIVINDGTIIIKYEDTNVDKDTIDFHSPFLVTNSASINGGNIYIIVPDGLKELFPKDIIGINNSVGILNPDKPIIKISKNANIVDGSKIDISKVTYKLEYTECIYDGKEKKPKVTMPGLKEDVDYEVSYSNNVNVGKGKVKVTGKGIYRGILELEFEIKPNGPSAASRFADKNLKYVVLKAGSTDGKIIGEVSVVGVNKKTIKKISVGAYVTNDGVKYRIVSIGDKAFSKLKKLRKVTIGKNVKKIGKKAFYGCKNLKTIIIKTKKLKKKSIGAKAFKGINIKAKFKVPKKKLKLYKKLIKKAKAPKKYKITK